MKSKKIGILCIFCATSFGTIEATPWAELEAFLAERSFSWTKELKNHVENIRKSANYLSKTERIGPWDGIREVLEKYPFLEAVFGTPPRISLQNGMFFGTEKEWREKHRRQLWQHLSYLKYFSERLIRETSALICIVQNIVDIKDVHDTKYNKENDLRMAWEDVRTTVYGSPYELTLPGEGNLRAEKQKERHEELRWQQEGQDEADSQKLKWMEGDMTEADIAQLLSQNGFSDKESISCLEADVENITKKYSNEAPASIPVFTEDLE